MLSSEEARSYKPQPELFQEMLRRLDAAPEACAYIGDRQFEDVNEFLNELRGLIGERSRKNSLR